MEKKMKTTIGFRVWGLGVKGCRDVGFTGLGLRLGVSGCRA